MHILAFRIFPIGDRLNIKRLPMGLKIDYRAYSAFGMRFALNRTRAGFPMFSSVWKKDSTDMRFFVALNIGPCHKETWPTPLGRGL